VLSYYIIPYYYLGDQEHYRNFYEQISRYDLENGYDAYKDLLGASVPIYFLLVYVFNNFLEKDFFISLFNGLLGFFMAKVLITLRIKPFLLFFFFFNFYFIVLLFAAERLKFGVLFFLISLLSKTSFKKNLYLLLSFFSHLQMILLVIVQYSSNFLIKIYNGKTSFLKKILYTFIGLAAILSMGYIMRNSIESKILANSHNLGIENIIKPAIFCLLSIIYCKENKLRVAIIFFPLILASFFVGEQRIVIFCYGIFCYYSISVNRGVNAGFIASTIYFTYKGCEFVYYILKNGNGFDNV